MTDQKEKSFITLTYNVSVVDNVGYVSTFTVEAQNWEELGRKLSKKLRTDETILSITFVKKGRTV